MSSPAYMVALLWVYNKFRTKRGAAPPEIAQATVKSLFVAYIANAVIVLLQKFLFGASSAKKLKGKRKKKTNPGSFLPAAIALDLDGTLFDDQSNVSDKTNKVLEKYASLGGTLIFATQQPPKGAQRFLSKISATTKENCYCVCAGGLVLVHCKDWSVRDINLLPASTVPKIINEALGAVDGLYMSIDGYSGWYTSDECYFDLIDATMPGVGSKLKKFAKVVKEDFANVLDREQNSKGAYRILFMHKTLPWKKGCELVKPALRELERTIGLKLEARPTGHEHAFEIGLKGLKKSDQLTNLCSNILNIDAENVMAFGDRENDIDMLQWAGYGFAMINGEKELKQLADKVTTYSNNEDGVAFEIEKVLNECDTVSLMELNLKSKMSQAKALEAEGTRLRDQVDQLNTILSSALDLEKKYKQLKF